MQNHYCFISEVYLIAGFGSSSEVHICLNTVVVGRLLYEKRSKLYGNVEVSGSKVLLLLTFILQCSLFLLKLGLHSKATEGFSAG